MPDERGKLTREEAEAMGIDTAQPPVDLEAILEEMRKVTPPTTAPAGGFIPPTTCPHCGNSF